MSTSNGFVPPRPLIDPFQRSISYLRVSVTDRCNLRCVYCMPEQGVPFVPHQEILTLEEMARIVIVCFRGRADSTFIIPHSALHIERCTTYVLALRPIRC